MTYTIETYDGISSLKCVDDNDVIKYIGIDLKNIDYQAFLTWNDEQQEPLELPEDWPTNE